MSNPQIQNDFSYYRRTLNRRKMVRIVVLYTVIMLFNYCNMKEGVSSMGAISSNDQLDIPDDVANRMSLFYANPTPVLHGLASATSQLLTDARILY